MKKHLEKNTKNVLKKEAEVEIIELKFKES